MVHGYGPATIGRTTQATTWYFGNLVGTVSDDCEGVGYPNSVPW